MRLTLKVGALREHIPQWFWNVRKIEGVDKEACVLGLAAALRSEKAAELVFRCVLTMGGHPLERAERTEFAFRFDHLLDRGGAERSNEFVF